MRCEAPPMLDIHPNVGVAGLTFGASPDEVQQQWGKPISTAKNRSGETVLIYPDILLTFDDAGLTEAGVTPGADPVVNGARPLSSKADFERLVRDDGQAQQVLGFIVLERLGLTITGVHDGDTGQLALTAFRAGRWARLQDQMTPFRTSQI